MATQTAAANEAPDLQYPNAPYFAVTSDGASVPFALKSWSRRGPMEKFHAAMSKAQSEMEGATKSSTNPFYSSSYADLAAVWEVIRASITKNGFCIIQMPALVKEDGNHLVELTTLIGHTSGAEIESTFRMPLMDFSPQAIGSLITYMRRYTLMAHTGIAPEDDDGNAAQQGAKGKPAPRRDDGPLSKKESTELRKRLSAELKNLSTPEAVRKWAGANQGVVEHLLTDDKAALATELKTKMAEE